MTLIDTKLAALMLRCTDRHVQKLIARGDLTNQGKRSAIRIDINELAAAIEQGRIDVQPERPPRRR